MVTTKSSSSWHLAVPASFSSRERDREREREVSRRRAIEMQSSMRIREHRMTASSSTSLDSSPDAGIPESRTDRAVAKLELAFSPLVKARLFLTRCKTNRFIIARAATASRSFDLHDATRNVVKMLHDLGRRCPRGWRVEGRARTKIFFDYSGI
jgi:hypothetical protein